MTIRKTLGSLLLAGSLAYATNFALAQGPSSSYTAQQASPAQVATIDIQAADNGTWRNQDDWIQFFNAKGVAMISIPDIYRAGQTGSDKLLESLRESSCRNALVTSTRIIYDPDSLDARIIHNYGSTVVKPTETKFAIPVYDRCEMTFSKLLRTEEGTNYLRVLFDTKDTPDKIAATLSRLSGTPFNTKDEGDYAFTNCVFTPLPAERKQWPERAVWFGYSTNGLSLRVDVSVDGGRGVSHSCGVTVNSDKKE